ncbi:monoglyceride lipase, putative [Entamoeba invadens IP1]|uniref:monoglyceride lipase, putative n=1 Tax=Entamoeba invadens IP1 TaxID=370355 RepID=UPI0002C3D90E|nr:monoglyceride lipase, putative [Entamoeba invadens IP1]ELP94055.1 monoglyceride lipase, putative [Entamoeba invadens IP1]|eukprot:XP_004260826.1 monoglyceride lipase, putative [Entamoeba invadens IP1]
MTEHIECFYDINNFKIFSREWQTKPPKAMIVLLHGYCGHSGRMDRLSEKLVASGILLCAPDHPYHGKSSGEPRAYIPSIQVYIDVENTYIDIVKEKYNSDGKIPMFVMGHSMGGLIASILSHKRNDLSGGIGSAPAYQINNFLVLWFYYFFALIVYFFPFLSVPGKVTRADFPTESAMKSYLSDPLITEGKHYIKSAIEMAWAGDNEMKTKTTIPFLLYGGNADRSVTMKGMNTKATNLNNEKSKVIVYEGKSHCLYEEDNLDEQVDNIMKWISNLSY